MVDNHGIMLSDFGFHSLPTIILILILSLLYFWKRNRNNFPQRPISWPVVGNVDILKSKPHIRLTNLKDRHGDIFGLVVGKHNVVVICSLEGVLKGLVEDGECFIGRPDFMSYNLVSDGDRQTGVSMADLDEKVCVKKLFIQESLESYCCTGNRLEERIASEVHNVTGKFLESEGCFDPFLYLKPAFLHIMLSLMFGKCFRPGDLTFDFLFRCFQARNDLRKLNIHDLLPLFGTFYKERHKKTSEQCRLLTEHLINILNFHKDSYNPENLRDVTDQLLLYLETKEDRGLLGSSDLSYLLMDMAGLGFESLPVFLTWLLGYMALYPGIQDAVQQELEAVVGCDRLPKLSDRQRLPYTMAVMHEAHRMASVFPFLLPHRSVNPCVYQGYNIPADTLFLFNVWSVHHDSRYWKQPMKFDPTRFLNDNKELEIPEHFLPFGAGLRQCVGQSLTEVEIFLFFTHFLHQMTIQPDSQIEGALTEPVYCGVLSPKPFKISVVARE